MAAVQGDAVAAPRSRDGGAAAVARRAADRTRAIGRRLSGSALTAAGLGLVDAGAFEANRIAGWIVTGLSVLLLDWTLE